MAFRLAVQSDLANLQTVFKELIKEMAQNKVDIWDDIYPIAYFEEDIAKKQLYVLTENNEILAALALTDTDPGENQVTWQDPKAKALYLTRFGVNPHYHHQGIGSRMLQEAIRVTRERQIPYLRLFVVDINQPAIQLYQKNGFNQVQGIYNEVIDEELTLKEYGYEINTFF